MPHDSSSGNTAAQRDLHTMWRGALAGAGLVLCFLSVVLFISPPRLAQQKGIGGANASLDQTQSDPSAFCIALLGAGVVLLLVAANGRKLLAVPSRGAPASEE